MIVSCSRLFAPHVVLTTLIFRVTGEDEPNFASGQGPGQEPDQLQLADIKMLLGKVDAENEQKHTQLKEALQKIEALLPAQWLLRVPPAPSCQWL